MTDEALLEVVNAMNGLDPDGSRTARVLRETLDQLYDGQHTGRYNWDQLMKTERTHCGTLVEINLQREFAFADGRGDAGKGLDFSIAGHQVDCKYSQRFGGWMIPTEAHDELCLVLTADDQRSTWSMGIIRAKPDWLNLGENRDKKVQIKAVHRDAHTTWLYKNEPLSPNVLLHLPDADRAEVFSQKSGQRRLDELFRRARGVRISRGVVATVAQQSDYMKRVRGNGGSRTRLAAEGIILLGDSKAHRNLAGRLGLPVPMKGETVSTRVAPTDWHWNGPQFELEGQAWRLATEEDPVVPAPTLPNPRKAVSADV